MRSLLAIALLGTVWGTVAAADGKPTPLAKVTEIPLEGGPFVDLMTVDSEGGRLYVAHSPRVDVVDLAKGTRVGLVEGVERAHAIAIVPALHRGFATSGQKNKLVVFDLATLAVAKEVDTGENPDGVIFVAATNEVWSFNGKGKSVTCVDPSTLEVKAAIPLEGKPELAVEDPGMGLVYVNLEDRSAVCVIDPKAHKVVTTHPVAPGEEPTGIAFDPKAGLLFVGCGNKKLVVLDTATWAAVTTVEIGERCDGVVFDGGTGTVFAAGNTTSYAIHEQDGKLGASQAIETPGGRTCAVDPKTHRIYLSTGPKRGEKGDVKVLVLGPSAAAAPAPAATPAATFTGRLEKAGPSVVMQGTHRLLLADGTSILLASSKIDLTKSEGKTVTVTGRAAPTVEGHQTIVDVETLVEAP